jgi:hypothetical protein
MSRPNTLLPSAPPAATPHPVSSAPRVAGPIALSCVASLLATLGVLALGATSAAAQHLDVRVDTSNGPVAGSQITTDIYGDVDWFLENVGSLPYAHDTGRLIVPGNFSDRPGGPLATDNPGFQSFRDDFGPGEEMFFRAMGTLQYLAPGATEWVAAAPGGGIRLYGSIPDDVVFDYVFNGIREDEYLFYEGGTLFTGTGVTGPSVALIGAASASGAMHYHLDWYLEGTAQTNTGAYLIEMQLLSGAQSGGTDKYLPSETFHILFNHGISTAQYADSLKTLTIAPAVPVPEPASVMLMLAGGALVAGHAWRRQRARRLG